MSEDRRTFDEVLEDELEIIRESRRERLGKDSGPFTGNTPTEKAHDAQLVGLAFSGGGIRSATFNLGVLQALAKRKLLRRFDYVSTVSGGGYIGSWLHAWTERRQGIKNVERDLGGRREPNAVSLLRRFSNYLTPKLGLFSADTWSAVATYTRNLTLTLSGLVPALGALVIIPYLVKLLTEESLDPGPGMTWVAGAVLATLLIALLTRLGFAARIAVRIVGGLVVLTGVLMLAFEWHPHHAWLGSSLSGLLIMVAFANIGRGTSTIRHDRVQGSVQRNVVLPTLAASWLGSSVLWHVTHEHPAV